MLRIRIQHEPHNFAETESDLTVEECTNKKGQNNFIGSICVYRFFIEKLIH